MVFCNNNKMVKGLKKNLILVYNHTKCLLHLRRQSLIAFCSTRRLPVARMFEFWDIHKGGEVNFRRGCHNDHSSEMFSTSFCKVCS